MSGKTCQGCMHLTPASVTGDGLRCSHPRATTPDYVTGGTFQPRAQQIRMAGPCGPEARLRETEWGDDA